MLFIAPNGGVVFDSRRGRTFTSATPTMKETCLSPLSKNSRGSRGPTVPPHGYTGSSGQFPEWLTFYVDDL